MKTLLFLLITTISTLSFAQEKNYEGYSDIVRKLSMERQQSVATRMSTTIPHRERFHLSLGVTNTSTSVDTAGLGGISQNGFLLGGAVPLVENQLFAEFFGKFFQSARENTTTADLRQYELRISHKEPLSFALFNMGVGTSVRFMNVDAPGINESLRSTNLLVTTGLERRITQAVSIAADFGYHYALTSDAKNTFEFALRMNYHL